MSINQMPLSYEETRLEILDSLYIHLIQNANNDQILRSSLDYLYMILNLIIRKHKDYLLIFVFSF